MIFYDAIYDYLKARKLFSGKKREEVALKISEILKRKFPNTFIETVLGSGSFGTALLLEDDTVIKLTRDKSELKSSKILEGLSLQHVAEIYGVYKITIKDGSKDKLLGIIHQENIPDKMGDYYPSNIINEIRRYLSTIAINKFSIPKILSYINSLKVNKWEKASGDAIDILYDVVTALEELYDNGVIFHDVHLGNIGYKDGRLVIYDLGVSKFKVRGKKIEIPEINRKKRK